MKRLGWYLGLCIALSACVAETNGGSGSESHWLEACESDAECAEGSCLCGICTEQCTSNAQCPEVANRCETNTDAPLLQACEKGTRPAGLCTRRDEESAESSSSAGSDASEGTDTEHSAATTSSADPSASNSEDETTAPETASADTTDDGHEENTDSDAELTASGTSESDTEASSTDEQPDSPLSSRLLPIVLEGEGVDPWRVGIWDKHEEVECEFKLAEDDQLRCLPNNVPDDVLQGYTDASCTTPAFTSVSKPWETSLGSTPYAIPTTITFMLEECSETSHYAVHEVVAEEGELYLMGTDGCYSPGLTRKLVSTGSIPADRWQAGIETAVNVTESYAVNRVTNEDVSFDLGITALSLSTECAPSSAIVADGAVAECLPAGGGSNYYYADASCSQMLMLDSSPCVHLYSLVSEEDGNWLRAASRPYIGELYRKVADGCELEANGIETSQALSLFTLGVERIAVPQLTAKREGDAALQLLHFVDGDVSLTTTGYWNSEREEACEPRLTAGGQLRCLPPLEQIYENEFAAFADSACTLPASRCEQLMAVYDSSGFAVLYAAGVEPSENNGVFTFQDLDGVQTCLRDSALSAGGARVPYCTRGEAIPLDSFPLLTRRVVEQL